VLFRSLDEVANGLSFYDYTFLHEVPRLHCALEDLLQAPAPAAGTAEIASFLRMGSWIGGDRDGNPFVTAEVLRRTVRMHSARALGFYLDELHTLGGELSLSTAIVTTTDELARLAARSPDRSPHRRMEPYRLAVSGIYARLAATARVLDDLQPGRDPVGEAAPYATWRELAADLDVLDRSLRTNGS
jgi:phosphoenolpyruvate carboxylase